MDAQREVPLDHALVPHLARALSLLVLTGCVGATRDEHVPPPPGPRTTAYVSPTGDDAADGNERTPYRTLAKALGGIEQRIVLLRGAYDEERIAIDRPVSVVGDGAVVVRGHVFITGNEVTLDHLSIGGGLAAHFVESLSVKNATISAGLKDDALSLTRSSASLAHVKLACGPMSCLQATTATVTIEDCIATGGDETKRVLRFETSKAFIRRSRLEKSATVTLQLSGGSLELTDTRVLGGGNAIVATQGATLIAKNVQIDGAARASLIGQRAKIRVDDTTFGRTLDQTIGLSGADAFFRRCTIEGSQKGTISVVDHLVAESVVRFEDGEIRHGRASGILVGSGVVTVAGTHFLGDPVPKGEGNDAITANGVEARVIVESARFDTPGAFAVAYHADASGTVTATVTKPRLGGILVEDVAADPVVVVRSVIKGCVDGSGVVAQGGKVVVDRTRVEGCKEAGVLAGDQASVRISSSNLIGNVTYGCAAFGGASIEASSTRIKGSKFATFASCGDGARVDDKGNNRLEGSVSACP